MENTDIKMETNVEETNTEKFGRIDLETRTEYNFKTKDRLKEVVKSYNDSFAELANVLEISYQSLNKKLNGHVDFKRIEIKIIKERYMLSADDIDYIFFDE